MTKEDHPSAETKADPLTAEPGAPAAATGPGHAHVVDVLNALLETTRDAEFDFQACADEAEAASLRQAFSRRAEECHEAADELVQLIWRFGGKPAEGGAGGSALHRGWVHIKGTAGADSDLSTLTECERREDAALARYRKALAQNLPPEVCSFLERQAQCAERSRDQLGHLRRQGGGAR